MAQACVPTCHVTLVMPRPGSGCPGCEAEQELLRLRLRRQRAEKRGQPCGGLRSRPPPAASGIALITASAELRFLP